MNYMVIRKLLSEINVVEGCRFLPRLHVVQRICGVQVQGFEIPEYGIRVPIVGDHNPVLTKLGY